MDALIGHEYKSVIVRLIEFDWENLTSDEMIAAASACYYFSVQFRENLETARRLFNADIRLAQLERKECKSSNLSPWPEVAIPGEKMHRDEFMRRALLLHSIPAEITERTRLAGETYLAEVRSYSAMTRALTISSYDDGGLEAVFRAILRYRNWDNSLLLAFRHFLIARVRLESNPDAGHGIWSRHLTPDDRVFPLWAAFQHLLMASVPRFQTEPFAGQAA
jgi:hypothetical protein